MCVCCGLRDLFYCTAGWERRGNPYYHRNLCCSRGNKSTQILPAALCIPLDTSNLTSILAAGSHNDVCFQ